MSEDYANNIARAYVGNSGGYCPECETTAPLQKRPEMTDCQDIKVEFKCLACNAEWEAWYVLDNVRSTEHGRHHTQSDMFQSTG